MKKLIIIEGIPGSGKTTLSKKLSDHLSKSTVTRYFSEGDKHPVDLSWQAILTKEVYQRLLKDHDNLRAQFVKNSLIEEDQVLLAYTNLGLDIKSDLYKSLANKEIYSQNTSLTSFKEAHLKRWQAFVESAEDLCYVFECVLLQNHITQLMLEYEADEETIVSYIKDFIKILEPLNLEIIYLRPRSVDKAIRHVAKLRTPEYQDRQDSWIERVVDYIAKSPYGISHELSGLEGFIEFTKKRQEIELRLLKDVTCGRVIHHGGDDWNLVLEDMIRGVTI